MMGENQTVDLVLPTDNDALFSGGGAAFYQYIERNYRGVKSTPWEGGRYGFVRNPIRTAEGNDWQADSRKTIIAFFLRFYKG